MVHEDTGSLAAVVMHPHPQYGGDMHNQVVVTAVEALASVGVSTLRFNFRGVGASEGDYDNGRGEANDARVAVAQLRGLDASKDLVIVGYSFGAMIAAAIAEESRPAALVLISPPVGMSAFKMPVVPCALVISGDRDTVSPAAAVEALASPSVTTKIAPGVDHGWWPGVDALAVEIVAFMRSV